MTVINPKSISGITSITLPSGGDNVLTIHTNDGAERFRIDSSGNVKVGSAATISPDGDVFFTGVCTATTLAGDGSGLTGVASTDNIRTNTNATFLQNVNVSGSTTTGTTIVGGGVTISESGIEASGIGITCANINGAQIGGRRNLIINGAMQVAQRGTSTTSSGYHTIDRWSVNHSVQNAPTSAQADVASGTTPYSLGFRKELKVTNGDQSNGATASSILYIRQFIEAQDIAQSGWNYTSSSSFITLSFWIKSSVAQSFHGHLRTRDGTAQRFPFQTGALSANTWTKITKKIPGNSNLQFDTDTTTNASDRGLDLSICPYMGTTYTDSGATFDQWQASTDSNFAGTDMTTTWFTTNDATLEITGVQLEVGSQATAFEHRSFGEELALCQRYFQTYINYAEYVSGGTGNLGMPYVSFTTPMRASPTFVNSAESKSSNWSFASMQVQGSAAEGYYAYAISFNTTNSNYGYMRRSGTASAEL